MTDHHKTHPEYGELGIFAGYGEMEGTPAAPDTRTIAQRIRCADLGPLADEAADLIDRQAEQIRTLRVALAFYLGVCGNTAAVVDRQSAMEAYTKASAALAATEGER